jgi:hypothetical protein
VAADSQAYFYHLLGLSESLLYSTYSNCDLGFTQGVVCGLGVFCSFFPRFFPFCSLSLTLHLSPPPISLIFPLCVINSHHLLTLSFTTCSLCLPACLPLSLFLGTQTEVQYAMLKHLKLLFEHPAAKGIFDDGCVHYRTLPCRLRIYYLLPTTKSHRIYSNKNTHFFQLVGTDTSSYVTMSPHM